MCTYTCTFVYLLSAVAGLMVIEILIIAYKGGKFPSV